MSAVGVRPASKREIKEITAWFVQERNKDSRFANLARTPWQRLIFGRWVLPRYLQSQANTFILEQEGRTAGFAVIEQAGEAVTLTDFEVQAGYDVDSLLLALTRTTEELARDREYRYARVAPLDTSEPQLALFRSAGYQLVDYYLWCFEGELAGGQLSEQVVLRALNPKDGLDRRLHFLRQELDASQVAGRAVIEESLLPKRPSAFPSFGVELAGAEGSVESQQIGYLSWRPDERRDGVNSIAVSLDPACWGTPLEVQAVAGAVQKHGNGRPAPVRVMISTTAHADTAAAGFAAVGLTRRLDARPILYKDLQSPPG